jgi:CBS domain-containing protein
MILVKHILDSARRRLVTLRRHSHVGEAAALLINPDTPLVVVCSDDGVAVGVISRADILKVIAGWNSVDLPANAEAVMTRCVFSFHPDVPLQKVWRDLNTRSFRSAPILDASGRPQGVLHVADIASALLEEVTNEEGLLRDYVLGVGYQ